MRNPDLLPPSPISTVINTTDLFWLLEMSIRQSLREPGFESKMAVELVYRHAGKLEAPQISALVELIETTANEPYTRRYRRDMENRARAEWRELVADLQKGLT